MTERMKPILGAMVAAIIVNYVGVTFLFAPIMANDVPGDPMLPAVGSLLVATIIFILFYDWVNQQVGHPMKSAMIIAVSQIMLVDIYYPLSGQRGLAAAGASIAVLLVSYGAVGFVYGMLLGDGGTAEAAG